MAKKKYFYKKKNGAVSAIKTAARIAIDVGMMAPLWWMASTTYQNYNASRDFKRAVRDGIAVTGVNIETGGVDIPKVVTFSIMTGSLVFLGTAAKKYLLKRL